MDEISRERRLGANAKATPGWLALWNRRLLVLAAVFVAWLATVLALQASGPEIEHLLAGEGMLISRAE